MNHGYYSVYTICILSHRKFAIDKPLTLQAQDLSMANYDDFGLRSYVCHIHLLYVVYIRIT